MLEFLLSRKKRIFVGAASLKKGIVAGLLVVCSMSLIHILAMMLIEKLSLMDAVWLTATTIVTVGYGDVSAKTPIGRMSTIVFMYGFGIYALATLVGTLLEWNQNVRALKRQGLWGWKMTNHLIIFATIKDQPERFFERLARQLDMDPRYATTHVLLAGESFPEGLPESLCKRGWAPYKAEFHDICIHEKTSASTAVGVIICALDSFSDASDAMVFDLAQRLREHLPKASPIIVECVSDAWRPRMQQVATGMLRPARAYPEMLGRALCSPGSESIVENLIDAGGDTLLRVNYGFTGAWGECAKKCLEAEIGLPLAYLSNEGVVVSNPKPSTQVKAQAIFLIAPEGQDPAIALGILSR